MTLAHVARPAYLARALDPARYEVAIASANRYRHLLGNGLRWHDIESIPSTQFLDALAHGRPLHDVATLRGYVREDLRLLEEQSPDVVVGDLRQSLAISARLAGVPYVGLVNAYWSPYAEPHFTVPSIPATRFLPIPVADALFHVVRPFAFRSHCAPMTQVGREFGLRKGYRDLREMYTDADVVVYPDLPQLVPARGRPEHHRYIGPILWSPEVRLPDWWDEIPQDQPLVYVTAGSSGAAALLESTFEALAGEAVTILAATVDYCGKLPENVFSSAYLPGLAAAERAALVVCNGGSPTAYQALAAGRPVLGLPANMDQHLNMWFVKEYGAGKQIRSDRVSARAIRQAVREMLERTEYRARARELRQALAAIDPAAEFEAALTLAAGGGMA